MEGVINMHYDLYDIVTIDQSDYLIASTYIQDKTQYFLLVETNEDEELNYKNIKVMKQSVYNNVDPDVLYPVIEETELNQVKKRLEEAMQVDLEDVA